MSAVVGETLQCEREDGNERDRYASCKMQGIGCMVIYLESLVLSAHCF